MDVVQFRFGSCDIPEIRRAKPRKSKGGGASPDPESGALPLGHSPVVGRLSSSRTVLSTSDRTHRGQQLVGHQTPLRQGCSKLAWHDLALVTGVRVRQLQSLDLDGSVGRQIHVLARNGSSIAPGLLVVTAAATPAVYLRPRRSQS